MKFMKIVILKLLSLTIFSPSTNNNNNNNNNNNSFMLFCMATPIFKNNDEAITVGSFDEMQVSINNAIEGDVLTFKPFHFTHNNGCTYGERLSGETFDIGVLLNKTITLQCKEKYKCIIECNESDDLKFYVNDGDDNNNANDIVIDGFYFKNNKGVSIQAIGDNVTIMNSKFVGNINGTSVYFDSEIKTSLKVMSSIFMNNNNNEPKGSGGTITALRADTVSLQYVVFIGNKNTVIDPDFGGGAFFASDTNNVDVQHSIFAKNEFDSEVGLGGGAISVVLDENQKFTLKNTIFYQNIDKSDRDAAISIDGFGSDVNETNFDGCFNLGGITQSCSFKDNNNFTSDCTSDIFDVNCYN